MGDVDTTRIANYIEALTLFKIKTLSDLELFLMKPDISNREKLETLYLTYAFYNDVMNYIEGRVSDLT